MKTGFSSNALIDIRDKLAVHPLDFHRECRLESLNTNSVPKGGAGGKSSRGPNKGADAGGVSRIIRAGLKPAKTSFSHYICRDLDEKELYYLTLTQIRTLESDSDTIVRFLPFLKFRLSRENSFILRHKVRGLTPVICAVLVMCPSHRFRASAR